VLRELSASALPGLPVGFEGAAGVGLDDPVRRAG